MIPDERADAASPTRARRLFAVLLLAVTVAAGLAVHSWTAESAASDIAGDALYAVAAYLAVVFIAPRLRPWQAGVIAGTWCTVIEVLQLTGVPELLGDAFMPAMLVLGTVFDARDLVIYLVAVAAAAGIDALARRTAGVRRPGMLDR